MISIQITNSEELARPNYSKFIVKSAKALGINILKKVEKEVVKELEASLLEKWYSGKSLNQLKIGVSNGYENT